MDDIWLSNWFPLVGNVNDLALENWLFEMFAFAVGSEYVRPSAALRGTTPLLSLFLLLIKLQKRFGFEVQSGEIMLVR